jgi:hypothetical protein
VGVGDSDAIPDEKGAIVVIKNELATTKRSKACSAALCWGRGEKIVGPVSAVFLCTVGGIIRDSVVVETVVVVRVTSCGQEEEVRYALVWYGLKKSVEAFW